MPKMPKSHAPVQEEYRESLRTLAMFLDAHLNGEQCLIDKDAPKKIGFALLMYPFGEDPDGRINYIGNSNRADMLKALKELVKRWEEEKPGEEPWPDDTPMDEKQRQ